jgi:protein TonB
MKFQTPIHLTIKINSLILNLAAMETTNRAIQNFNELIFENKHKAYGAYALRKEQNDTISRSLIITISFFGLLLLAGVIYTNRKVELPNTAESNVLPILTKIIEVNIPEKKIIEPKIELKEPAPLKTTTGNMEVVDHKVENNVKPNDQQVISKIENSKGFDSAALKPFEIPITHTITISKKPETYVDEMPSFDNLQQYIANNLQYPPMAVETGVSGTVYLSFVIETDGSVSDVKTLRGIGTGCEEEATRVVKSMPKWKPGKNHGELVRVQFNLPVKFRLK